MKNLSSKLLLLCLALSSLVFSACQEEQIDPNAPTPLDLGIRRALVDLMEEWYFWNERVPNIDINNFNSHEDVLDAMVFKELDRWTYLIDSASFNQLFDRGELIGMGVNLTFDRSDRLMISAVTPESPADEQGLRRGLQITHINGVSVPSLSNVVEALGPNQQGLKVDLRVQNIDGSENREVSVTKRVFNLNPINRVQVLDRNDRKIGYFVFNSFLGVSDAQLQDAFRTFEQAGVQDLILDLRYNGGGLLSMAEKISSMIGGSNVVGKLMVEIAYNDNKNERNERLLFQQQPVSLNLPRVFVITSPRSASASEVVINGLKPHIEVFTVGTRTYGKPVGSIPFELAYLRVLPITLRLTNANGEADYFNGIPANGLAADGISFDFGDEREASLAEALFFIENGFFNQSSGREARMTPRKQVKMNAWQMEAGVF